MYGYIFPLKFYLFGVKINPLFYTHTPTKRARCMNYIGNSITTNNTLFLQHTCISIINLIFFIHVINKFIFILQMSYENFSDLYGIDLTIILFLVYILNFYAFYLY